MELHRKKGMMRKWGDPHVGALTLVTSSPCGPRENDTEEKKKQLRSVQSSGLCLPQEPPLRLASAEGKICVKMRLAHDTTQEGGKRCLLLKHTRLHWMSNQSKICQTLLRRSSTAALIIHRCCAVTREGVKYHSDAKVSVKGFQRLFKKCFLCPG